VSTMTEQRDITKPTLDIWAQSLNNQRLAEDLRRLSEDVRYFGTTQRVALLREAARRLEPQ
jgi:hypothetical protein